MTNDRFSDGFLCSLFYWPLPGPRKGCHTFTLCFLSWESTTCPRPASTVGWDAGLFLVPQALGSSP